MTQERIIENVRNHNNASLPLLDHKKEKLILKAEQKPIMLINSTPYESNSQEINIKVIQNHKSQSMIHGESKDHLTSKDNLVRESKDNFELEDSILVKSKLFNEESKMTNESSTF